MVEVQVRHTRFLVSYDEVIEDLRLLDMDRMGAFQRYFGVFTRMRAKEGRKQEYRLYVLNTNGKYRFSEDHVLVMSEVDGYAVIVDCFRMGNVRGARYGDAKDLGVPFRTMLDGRLVYDDGSGSPKGVSLGMVCPRCGAGDVTLVEDRYTYDVPCDCCEGSQHEHRVIRCAHCGPKEPEITTLLFAGTKYCLYTGRIKDVSKAEFMEELAKARRMHNDQVKYG